MTSYCLTTHFLLHILFLRNTIQVKLIKYELKKTKDISFTSDELRSFSRDKNIITRYSCEGRAKNCIVEIVKIL
jgi:hypothetical protein